MTNDELTLEYQELTTERLLSLYSKISGNYLVKDCPLHKKHLKIIRTVLTARGIK